MPHEKPIYIYDMGPKELDWITIIKWRIFYVFLLHCIQDIHHRINIRISLF